MHYLSLRGGCRIRSKTIGRFVFHHAKFDMHQLRSSFGLHIPYPVHDTMVMSFMIDNRGAWAFDPSYLRDHHKRQAHSLKTLAKWYVDPHAEDAERELMKQIRARGGKHKGDWLMADEKVFGKYSWQDPWYTLQLYLLFQEMIDGWVTPKDLGFTPVVLRNRAMAYTCISGYGGKGRPSRRRFLRTMETYYCSSETSRREAPTSYCWTLD
jgi:hypothetical protein